MSESHDDTFEAVADAKEATALDSSFEETIMPQVKAPVEQASVDLLPLDDFSPENDLPEFIPNHIPEVRADISLNVFDNGLRFARILQNTCKLGTRLRVIPVSVILMHKN